MEQNPGQADADRQPEPHEERNPPAVERDPPLETLRPASALESLTPVSEHGLTEEKALAEGVVWIELEDVLTRAIRASLDFRAARKRSDRCNAERA